MGKAGRSTLFAILLAIREHQRHPGDFLKEYGLVRKVGGIPPFRSIRDPYVTF